MKNKNHHTTSLRHSLTLTVGILSVVLMGLQANADHGHPDRPGRPGRPGPERPIENNCLQYGPRGNALLTLNFYGQQFYGQNTIPIKREARTQCGRQMNIKNYELKAVRMMAVSAAGRGEAALTIDGFPQDRTVVPGSQREFRQNIYSRLRLRNYGYDSKGPWQVELRGNIKIDRIVLVLQDRGGADWDDGNGGGADWEYIKWTASSQEFKAAKPNPWGVDMTQAAILSERGNAIAIEATSRSLRVEQVVAYTHNGRSLHLPELTGTLAQGDKIVAHIPYSFIRKVEVTATSSSFNGSRATYVVKVGTSRRR